MGGLERVGLAAKARVQLVQRGEVGVCERALAEGPCEVDEERRPEHLRAGHDVARDGRPGPQPGQGHEGRAG